ncbi:Uncharacterised protein [Bordetella pertussis]|nr:Uncharacterised protein [Bordetella pertussis]CFU94311.1 Uncharacterised protein [Bordetella pertussis]CPM69664.1 Uncharacterised protein [Bordetella pertussis]CPO33894.1 Uncharacterised protein [Bordetella pertussis]CPP02260.1 Uncharacterised protein [Bordetella pertussis]
MPNLRSESPPLGCSILMTSAPKSAMMVPQNGAARKVAISNTRNPDKALGGCGASLRSAATAGSW